MAIVQSPENHTDADVQWGQARARQRVLRWFVRQGYLDCARPPFALERLEAIDAHRLMYRLPKPKPDGCE